MSTNRIQNTSLSESLLTHSDTPKSTSFCFNTLELEIQAFKSLTFFRKLHFTGKHYLLRIPRVLIDGYGDVKTVSFQPAFSSKTGEAFLLVKIAPFHNEIEVKSPNVSR